MNKAINDGNVDDDDDDDPVIKINNNIDEKCYDEWWF